MTIVLIGCVIWRPGGGGFKIVKKCVTSFMDVPCAASDARADKLLGDADRLDRLGEDEQVGGGGLQPHRQRVQVRHLVAIDGTLRSSNLVMANYQVSNAT